jgi:hypothetical protein
MRKGLRQFLRCRDMILSHVVFIFLKKTVIYLNGLRLRLRIPLKFTSIESQVRTLCFDGGNPMYLPTQYYGI